MRTARAPGRGSGTVPAEGSFPGETACPVCKQTRRVYLFVVQGLPVCRCPDCGLVLLSPQPAPGGLEAPLRGGTQHPDSGQEALDTRTEEDASKRYLEQLVRRGVTAGRILFCGPEGHPFPAIAMASQFQVVAQRPGPHLGLETERQTAFDAAVLIHQVQTAARPGELMEAVREALRPTGVLLLTLPSATAWPRRFFGSRWTEWRPENLYYFSPTDIQALLLGNGFAEVWSTPDRRLYTLNHIAERAAGLPRTALTRMLLLAHRLSPSRLRQAQVRFASSGIVVTARPVERRPRPLCSVVVPAYNERATVHELLQALLAKEIPGADKEVIVVESNSTDGTREIVNGFKHHPDIRILLQDRPRGKGNAVRLGLEHARGEVVLIQDADLEYDLRDYDSLVEPLLRFTAALVLGSRHTGHWKMRKFTDSNGWAAFFNLGHLFFTSLVNIVYRQRLNDPFTMYKVFWRDCLYGLKFECNRFDFDFELLIKLLRKGYAPIEIPVNYQSRSLSEGKKVGLVGDPLSWIWATFKYRFASIGEGPSSSPNSGNQLAAGEERERPRAIGAEPPPENATPGTLAGGDESGH